MIRKTPVRLDREYVEHLVTMDKDLLRYLKGPEYKNMRRAVRLRISEFEAQLTFYGDPVLVYMGFQRRFDNMESAATRIRGAKYMIEHRYGDQAPYLKEIDFFTRNAEKIAEALRENTSVPKYVETVRFDMDKNPLDGVWFDK